MEVDLEVNKISMLLIYSNSLYRRYQDMLLIPEVDVPTSLEGKCNKHICDTAFGNCHDLRYQQTLPILKFDLTIIFIHNLTKFT